MILTIVILSAIVLLLAAILFIKIKTDFFCQNLICYSEVLKLHKLPVDLISLQVCHYFLRQAQKSNSNAKVEDVIVLVKIALEKGVEDDIRKDMSPWLRRRLVLRELLLTKAPSEKA